MLPSKVETLAHANATNTNSYLILSEKEAAVHVSHVSFFVCWLTNKCIYYSPKAPRHILVQNGFSLEKTHFIVTSVCSSAYEMEMYVEKTQAKWQ